MKNGKSVAVKITADKEKYYFENEKLELVENDKSYKQVSSPFFNYIFEEIKKMRESEKITG